MSNYIKQHPFSCDLALVQNQKRLFGFINKKNKEVISCAYYEAYDFYQNLAIVAKKEKKIPKYGIINSKGNIILECVYNEIFIGAHNSLFVTKEKKKGVYYENGKLAIHIEYDEIQQINPYLLLGTIFKKDGSKIKEQHLYRLNDLEIQKGKNKIYTPLNPLETNTDKFYEVIAEGDYIRTHKKNKYALLDEKGNLLIPPQYNTINILHKTKDNIHLFLCKINDKYGIVTQHNNIIIPFEYQSIKEHIAFDKYLIVSRDKKKYGIIDLDNHIIIPIQYGDFINTFVQEDTFVVNEQLGKDTDSFFVVNTKHEIISEKYHYLSQLTPNIYLVITHQDKESENVYALLNPQTFAFYSEQRFSDVERFWDYHLDKDLSFASDNIIVSQKKGYEELYGIFSIKENKMKIPFQYALIHDAFYGKRFIVSQKETYAFGLIDDQNNILTLTEYEEFWHIYGDNIFYIKAILGEKTAILDENGKILLPLQTGRVKNVSKKEHTITIKTEEVFSIDTNGKEKSVENDNNETQNLVEAEETPSHLNHIDQKIWEFEYKHTHQTQKNWKQQSQTNPPKSENDFMEKRYVHKNIKNLVVKHPQDPTKYLTFLGDDMMGYYTLENTTQIMDMQGKILAIPHTLVDFGVNTTEQHRIGFKNGYCVVAVLVNDQKFYNIIDKKGDYMLPMRYESITDAGNNVYIVGQNKKYGLLHIVEGEVCNLMFLDADVIDCSIWGMVITQYRGRPKMKTTEIRKVVGKGLLWGTTLSSNSSFEIYKMGKEGIWYHIVDQQGQFRFGMIDWEGNTILRPIYDMIDDTFYEERLLVCLDGKWGFVNQQGKTIIMPQFDEATPFKNGISHVVKRNTIEIEA